MALASFQAHRYVTALREGGSLPAVVDTDDGLYVVKFRGAGQGARALIAEILVAELARALALPVPQLAIVEVDERFGRSERDPEIRDILKASVGINVGMRYLEGAFNFDPAADTVDDWTASRLVWLDAFCSNVDRTARNPNLMWSPDPHAADQLWLIDHGAALYFHHNWNAVDDSKARDPFDASAEHVLLAHATELGRADDYARPRLGPERFGEMLAQVPDALLMDSPAGRPPPFDHARANRDAYARYFSQRLAHSTDFVEAAERARHARANMTPQRQGYRR